jgi:predicted MFS family arabinose efflux permease
VLPALVGVGLLNYLDRALPSILAEPIKHELQLSDTALGFINGAGFLLVYAFAAVPIARIADRGRQVQVISASLAVWSFMTLIAGAVASGWQLALTRMGVALGEAGSLPASHSYLTQRYPPERRVFALSMLSLAVPLGNSFGLVAGGTIGRTLGWREAFIAMGLAGLVLVPLIHLILKKGAALQSGSAPPSPRRVKVVELGGGSGLGLILAGASLVAIGGYSAIAFVPAFLMRVHGVPLDVVGFRYGLGAGVAGVTALLVMGWWCDRIVARGAKSPLPAVVIMILAAVPFITTALIVSDSKLALTLAAVGSIVPVAYLAPVVASLHRLVAPHHRAQVSALLLLCTALVGGSGPLAVGIVSDLLRAMYGNASLGRAMLIIPVAYALAAAVFWLAARRYPLEYGQR